MKTPLALAATLLTLPAGPLWAACTSPAGTAGEMIFNTTTKTMQYCNGTNWVNTGKSEPAATQSGCSSPTGPTGTVIYNNALGVIQFCNGQNWINTACAANRSPNGSGCSGKPAGTIQYVGGPVNELQFCDSTNWVAMGWGCVGSAANQTGLIDWSLAQEIQKLSQSDPTQYDEFGSSSALSGSSAIIGAAYKTGNAGSSQGAAYVFNRSGATWTQQAKLIASDPAASDAFGSSVALDGDTALVGVPDRAGPTASGQGAAYIFTRSGSTWTQQAKLLASDPAVNDHFGVSVAISGDTALVGAYGKNDTAGSYQGVVYVFTRSGTTWTQQAKLTASDPAQTDHFGRFVTLSGNTALVGAPAKNGPAGSLQGAGYVFIRSGITWTQQAKLLASDPMAGDNFGFSVALSGDTALLGAYGKNDTAGSYQGVAYVFTRSGTTWTQQAKLIASDPTAGDYFGRSVALSGNTAAIGAHRKNGPAGTRQGAAYIFTRNGTVWTQQKKLLASDPTASDYFGYSVALSTDTALIGANNKTGAAGTFQGAAYIFSPE